MHVRYTSYFSIACRGDLNTMYLLTTVPHPHAQWQLHALLGNNGNNVSAKTVSLPFADRWAGIPTHMMNHHLGAANHMPHNIPATGMGSTPCLPAWDPRMGTAQNLSCVDASLYEQTSASVGADRQPLAGVRTSVLHMNPGTGSSPAEMQRMAMWQHAAQVQMHLQLQMSQQSQQGNPWGSWPQGQMQMPGSHHSVRFQ